MYVPDAFAESDVATLHALMRRHPLTTLVSLNEEGLEASHVPLVLYPDDGEFGTLRGHLARANRQWATLDVSVEALCIFHGPEGYITPSWYQTKAETGKVVPTWNYVTVHARGALRIVQDADWLLENVNAVTDQHEQEREARWYVSDAPDRYIQTMLRGIVGVEIPISRLEGKWKLGQNRPEADRRGVIEGLNAERQDNGELAALTSERHEAAGSD